MREMVFRERHERVAHVDAIAKIVAKLFNADADKAFGGIVADYAFEVFQESYDVDMLRRRMAIRKQAQRRVRERREHDENMLKKLEALEKAADNFEPVKPEPKKTKKLSLDNRRKNK